MYVQKNKKTIKYKLTGIPPFELLLERGLIVGKNFDMLQECIIDDSHCHRIKIGNNVTLAPRVHILAHDASLNKFIGVVKEGDVIIGNSVFVGANTTILCDTVIGDNVVIGANSLVTKDIPNNEVWGGNPAKFICTITEYIKKVKGESNPRMTYLKTNMLEKVI